MPRFSRRGSPVEGLEEAAQVLFGKAGTRVGDLHFHPLLIQENAPADLSPGGGIAKGVGDHIVENLRQSMAVQPHRPGTEARILQSEMHTDYSVVEDGKVFFLLHFQVISK